MPDPAIHSIDLEKAFLSAGEDMSYYLANSDPGERVVMIGDVLAGIEAAKARGARVVLLSIDSFGGSMQAGVDLRNALDRFRAGGGFVVAFLAGMAGSCASWFYLPADYVVAHSRSTIHVHGTVTMSNDGKVSAAPDPDFDQARALKALLLRAGTTVPEAEIQRWIGTPGRPEDVDGGGRQLNAREARAFNFADEIGGRMRALEVARRFAEGRPVRSPRQEAIAPRLRELARQMAAAPVPAVLDGILARRMGGSDFLTSDSVTSDKFAARAVVNIIGNGAPLQSGFNVSSSGWDNSSSPQAVRVNFTDPLPDTDYSLLVSYEWWRTIPLVPVGLGNGVVTFHLRLRNVAYADVALMQQYPGGSPAWIEPGSGVLGTYFIRATMAFVRVS